MASQSDLKTLHGDIAATMDKLGIADLEKKLDKLTAERDKPDFWSDNARAQSVSRQISKLEGQIQPWQALAKDSAEMIELFDLKDADMTSELDDQFADLQRRYEKLKTDLRFSGPYDDHDAIVSIHAGAGGTDAQDWTQMLLRMYVRWAEASKMSVTTVEESAGDEAGIKSATVEIAGSLAYGKLKGEHGVHRLVRLSPFNSDNLRQTSFAKVEVMPRIDRPSELAIDEKDLKIDVYRSGGKGGQSVNTTDSAVRVTHLPTGLVVAIQNERSQLQNRETAMTILRSRLAQLQLEQHTASVAELKGPNEQAAWGNQIRSYVLHPYKQVKDLRTRYETSDVDGVLDGALDPLIEAYLEHSLGEES